VEVGQHVGVVVRHHRLPELAGAHVAAADHQRNLDPLAGHRRQPGLDRGAFRRARRITANRFVDRRQNFANT
jgi:hypothetical protein